MSAVVYGGEDATVRAQGRDQRGWCRHHGPAQCCCVCSSPLPALSRPHSPMYPRGSGNIHTVLPSCSIAARVEGSVGPLGADLHRCCPSSPSLSCQGVQGALRGCSACLGSPTPSLLIALECQRIIPCLTSMLTPPTRLPLYDCVAPGTHRLQC